MKKVLINIVYGADALDDDVYKDLTKAFDIHVNDRMTEEGIANCNLYLSYLGAMSDDEIYFVENRMRNYALATDVSYKLIILGYDYKMKEVK